MHEQEVARELVKNPELTFLILSNVATVALVLLRELFSMFKNETKENTIAMRAATIAITKLTAEMEQVKEDLQAIPGLQQKLSEAHVEIASLKERWKAKCDKGR